MHGTHVVSSAYAGLILEAIEGGGVLLTISEDRTMHTAQINLSASQVAQVRKWIDTDRADARSNSVAPE